MESLTENSEESLIKTVENDLSSTLKPKRPNRTEKKLLKYQRKLAFYKSKKEEKKKRRKLILEQRKQSIESKNESDQTKGTQLQHSH